LRSLLAVVDADRFAASSIDVDPDVLARDVYPLERAYEILANYTAELARTALEAAGIEPESGPRDLRRLAEEGALEKARAERLVTVLQHRNALVHEYPDLRARMVYDAATLLERELGPFVRELTMWLVAGPPDRA
jgi:uncharacterized protein YutE (UPF0331/DUF86 family)